jgi:hypothetical protein
MTGKVPLLIAGLLATCIITVGFVLGITWLRPDADNTSLITTIIGVMVPVVIGLGTLLAAAVHAEIAAAARKTDEIATQVNGHTKHLESLAAVDAEKIRGMRNEISALKDAKTIAIDSAAAVQAALLTPAPPKDEE